MALVECSYEQELMCSSMENIVKTRDNIYWLKTVTTTYYLFVTRQLYTIICSGTDFQVFVWGKNKYILWKIPPGNNICIALYKASMIPINEHTYYVCRNCLNLEKIFTYNMLSYIDYLRSLYRRKNIFIIDRELGIVQGYENILSIENSEDLFNYIRDALKSKGFDEKAVDKLVYLIKERIVTPSILEKLKSIEYRGKTLFLKIDDKELKILWRESS